jgi:ribose transport system substrate-binding protein
MRIAANRSRPVAAVAVVGALVLAGCSTQQQGANSTSASGGASGSGCKPSAQVTQQYNKAWQQAEKGLGLSGIKPTKTKLCMVNTTKYKKSRTNGQYRIALAAQGPTNSWATENEEAFRYEAKKKNVKVLYASADGDATKQVGNIQQLRAQNPDAMVVVPMGSGITGQVQAAAKQGIPVVLCSGKLGPNSGAVSTVTRSYAMQGTLWADWLIKAIGGKGKIAMLSGIPGVPTAEFPKAAAEKVFAQHPGIKVVAKQYDQWSPTTAKTVAANLLAQHPDLAGIWSDSGFGDIGVAEAYKQAGKPVPPVTGDSSNAFLKAAQGTKIKFGLSPFPPGMSMQCLDTAVQILQGKSVPNFINVQAPTYTNAELAKYIRPSCSENLWVPSELPDSLLRQLKLC